MAKFFHDSVDWFRKSFSEHDGIRQTNSLDLPSQGSCQDSPTPRKPRSISTSGVPGFGPLDSLDEGDLYMMPEIDGELSIFTEEEVEALCHHLPPRLSGASWILRFSTEKDGFSLNSIYRKLEDFRSPTLLVIHDTRNFRFGALVSDSFRILESFYGTGESFLFRLPIGETADSDAEDLSPTSGAHADEDLEDSESKLPNIQVWRWSTKNEYFITCSPQSLSIGAGDGQFGLTIDSDLHHGRTDHCATYDNEPLDPHKDFNVKSVEVWNFR
ncbi:hypothetical protein TCAL_08482 [Tigriopus californicus]|uniref:Oxidation resistance protein 1 n=1 Tax=Tigriopus californicus TaxID=6832 RepID=A0A553NQG6_TIGCA|nr:TLD domain-containing protein 2-like [Tigriopus californicus]TRY67664.1 hypothetical protein TCAL_08482 [Tigriopus californicus]|eukprot:TCALIF_08482-PA protein Name:"Similar to TLDC2 TLD domain-containing protein 2 (Bos taurus)" AED:0.11 eAED:0.11 QI:0/-1/0/1/-1/1/1/0/270